MPVFASLDKLWNLGSEPITFSFPTGQHQGTDIQHQKVKTAIKEWEQYGQIQFQECSDPQQAHLRISFDPEGDSWSLVGKDATRAEPRAATMNLAWLDSQTAEMNKGERAVILRTFGQALGLLDENLSPGGGGIPEKNIELAIKFYGVQEGWTADRVREKIIKPYSLRAVSAFSKIDRTSIMHYPMPKAVSGLPFDIAYNYELSELDKAFMAIMYPRKTAASENPEWTLQHALDVSGLSNSDVETTREILREAESAANGTVEPTHIREIVSAWAQRANAVSRT